MARCRSCWRRGVYAHRRGDARGEFEDEAECGLEDALGEGSFGHADVGGEGHPAGEGRLPQRRGAGVDQFISAGQGPASSPSTSPSSRAVLAVSHAYCAEPRCAVSRGPRRSGCRTRRRPDPRAEASEEARRRRSSREPSLSRARKSDLYHCRKRETRSRWTVSCSRSTQPKRTYSMVVLTSAPSQMVTDSPMAIYEGSYHGFWGGNPLGR